MYATNHFETEILNNMRGVALTAPAKMYIALFLTDPTDTGQAGVEVNYAEYARQEVTFSAPASVTGGIGVQNDAQITFPKASENAGSAAYIGIMDSASGGNMWAYGKLSDPLAILSGTAPVFAPGDLAVSFTGDLTNAYKTKYLNVLCGQTVGGFNLYVSLYNGDPDNGGAELSGTNYARVALAMTAPSESETGQMRSEYSAAAAFNRPSASWGNWTYTALYDSASGGQAVWRQAKVPSWELKTGRMPIIEQGALKLAIN